MEEIINNQGEIINNQDEIEGNNYDNNNDDSSSIDINSLKSLIEAQNNEIKQLKDMLSEQFTNTDNIDNDPIEEYLNSEESLTGRIMKKFTERGK